MAMVNFMKKILLLCAIPLALTSQEVFAAQFRHNSYYFQSPTMEMMDRNISQAQQRLENYNSNLKNELQRIQRNPSDNHFFDNDLDEDNFRTPIQASDPNTQQTSSPVWDRNAQSSTNKLNPSRTYSQDFTKERSQPTWWRQENSFQGWGFD